MFALFPYTTLFRSDKTPCVIRVYRRSSAAEYVLAAYVLFAAAAHDRFGDRGRQRRRDLYFDRLRGLAVENLADELLARFGIFRGAGLGFDGRPLFRRDLLDSQSVLLEVVAQPFQIGRAACRERGEGAVRGV